MSQTLARRRELYRTDPEYRSKAIAAASASQAARKKADPSKFLGDHARYSRNWRAANPEKARASRIAEYDRKRKQVFDHYGWICACCGSDDRISIDHIDGNGGTHRMEIFGSRNVSGDRMRAWLIRNGFPAGFQTLCMPCNCSKRNGPACRIDHASRET